MQNQSQSIAGVTAQVPDGRPDSEIVVLERSFRQRQTNARPGIGLPLYSDKIGALHNLAFIRKAPPAGAVEALVVLCTDLAENYARAAKMCEAYASSFALCVAAHKQAALLSDASNRLRALAVSVNAPHEKRRVLAAVFEAVLGASAEGKVPLGCDFKKCLNDDSLPVEFRVGLAVLYAQIRQNLRQTHALRRAVDES